MSLLDNNIIVAPVGTSRSLRCIIGEGIPLWDVYPGQGEPFMFVAEPTSAAYSNNGITISVVTTAGIKNHLQSILTISGERHTNLTRARCRHAEGWSSSIFHHAIRFYTFKLYGKGSINFNFGY